MKNQVTVSARKFANLPEGVMGSCITIQNKAGEFVELLDFGAVVHSINVKDFIGEIGNVVVDLGQGGRGNFIPRLFRPALDGQSHSACLRLCDDGEASPGCPWDALARFTFGDDHCLEILQDFTPYQDTPVCPVSGAFFNLSGGGDALNHKLKINTAPGGNMDFSYRRTLREALLSARGGFTSQMPADDAAFFVLSKKGFGEAAELLSPETGRMLRVLTDLPALVLFMPRPPGEASTATSAIGLFAQFFPEPGSGAQPPRALFRKGVRYHSRTVFEFTTLFELREV